MNILISFKSDAIQTFQFQSTHQHIYTSATVGRLLGQVIMTMNLAVITTVVIVRLVLQVISLGVSWCFIVMEADLKTQQIVLFDK